MKVRCELWWWAHCGSVMAIKTCMVLLPCFAAAAAVLQARLERFAKEKK
jgi:hypothetical protein